jgi:hypothetical protein
MRDGTISSLIFLHGVGTVKELEWKVLTEKIYG